MYWPQTSFQKSCISCLVIKTKKNRVSTDIKATRATKAQSRQWSKKIKLNDLTYQHSLTQPVFNRMRVLEEKLWFAGRGIEPYCISCQKTHRTWSCGHYKTVGHQGNLRYCRTNTFLQCWWSCNKNLSGNIGGNKNSVGFTQGIIERFSEKEGQQIIDYCDGHTEIRKWTGVELKDFRAECSVKIRDLERELTHSTNSCYKT